VFSTYCVLNLLKQISISTPFSLYSYSPPKASLSFETVTQPCVQPEDDLLTDRNTCTHLTDDRIDRSRTSKNTPHERWKSKRKIRRIRSCGTTLVRWTPNGPQVMAKNATKGMNRGERYNNRPGL
jgi:hypothetical protein